MTVRLPKQIAYGLRSRSVALILGSVFATTFFVACGTDFVEPAPVGARSDTPVAQATVFRVIEVTPIATPTELPPAIGPDGAIQRPFPSEIDPSRSGTGLPPDAVMGFWSEYLADARLVVEDRLVDVHICANGTLIPGTPSTFVNAGTWGLRPTSGEWYEVILGREFRAGRISGFVTLSRIGGATVAINDHLAVVSVTDSDLCDEIGDL